MINAWISSIILKKMRALCAAKYPLETGGLLFGYWADNGEPVIEVMVGPGPKAQHNRFTFEPDYDFHDLEVDKIYADKENRNYYLGDWHCHPYPGEVALSVTDIETLVKIGGEVSPRSPLTLIIGGKEWEILKIWADKGQLSLKTF